MTRPVAAKPKELLGDTGLQGKESKDLSLIYVQFEVFYKYHSIFSFKYVGNELTYSDGR
jgi:hypothetical protein